ncbi:hypothetical protein Q5752_000085 [Cryptotrichosporon argae]
MSHTPVDPHFVQNPDLDLLSHRPHVSARLLYNAVTATALFRVWPTLLFYGAWSTMVVLVNVKTSVHLRFPNTMITVLGVLLGLTLSYRTSSAYDRYWEGRRMWSQIVLASRTWARTVWIHCPNTVLPAVPDDPAEKARDEARGLIEKRTVVRMAEAFAAALKHYLRGEEGTHYEDLYDLVNFIPALDFPSGLPDPTEASMRAGLPRHRRPTVTAEQSATPSTKDMSPSVSRTRPTLRPARLDPDAFDIRDVWPIRLLFRSRRSAAGKTDSAGSAGHNVPLEIAMFMSSWVAAMQRRKTVDVPTINMLLTALTQLMDALTSLERILTTPIPWSYNAHIWEVTWVYCLALPFQLYASGFGWVTIPAVMITTYIVVGFAEIGSEIENPFGYDRNDLNLDLFVQQVRDELARITARPFSEPAEWVFTPNNRVFGPYDQAADAWQNESADTIRARLAVSARG